MSCAHCCMSCGANYKGQNMSLEVFNKALELCEEYGSYITLGGGEPLLHPQFHRFLALSVNSAQTTGNSIPWFATNGSLTTKVKNLIYGKDSVDLHIFDVLSKYAPIELREDLYCMAISQDEFHDPIDPSVIELAKKYDVELRDVSGHVRPAGHAALTGAYNSNDDDKCVCSAWQIKPDGQIYLCGCDDAPLIGDVYNGINEDIISFNGYLECISYWDEECDENIEGIDLDDTLSKWVDKNMPVRRNRKNDIRTFR